MKTSELLRRFVPGGQFSFIADCLRGEEKEHFKEIVTKLKETILNAPVTYEQEGKGEKAEIHLHYFVGGCDWFVTEIDTSAETEQLQAYGLVNLGHGLEYGYISIADLLKINGVEIDLYWKIKKVKELIKRV